MSDTSSSLSKSRAVPSAMKSPTATFSLLEDAPQSIVVPGCRTLSTPSPLESHLWHRNYSIPFNTLSVALQRRLREKSPETPLLSLYRGQLLEALYSSITKKCLYPTSAQYVGVAEKLLEQCPGLLPQGGLTYGDAMTLWKDRIQTKFQNGRRRDHKDLPEVFSRKRRKACRALNMGSESETPPAWGLANYLPERPASEDDASIKRHIQWLKDEKRKKKPNFVTVGLLMDKTFAERRKLIVSEPISIQEMKEEYPWLFANDGEELYEEFTRISGADEDTADKLICSGLKKYGTDLLKQVRSVMKEPDVIKDLMKEAERKQGDERKNVLAIAAILAPSFLLKENPMLMLLREAEDGDASQQTEIQGQGGAPVLVYTGKTITDSKSFTLKIEDVAVTECVDLIAAFAAYLVSFYIFNLLFPKDLEKTLNFYQKVYLGIDDGKKTLKPVVKLLDKLQYAKN